MVGRLAVVLVLALVLVAGAHAAASPVADEQRLAMLAGKMLNLTGKDYSMDCGPGKEVLNLLPKETDLSDTPYCVLNTSGTIIFGTFSPFSSGDLAQKLSEMVSIYNDTAYRAQIQVNDINLHACDDVATSGAVVDGFVECQNANQKAIRYTVNGRKVNLYTYAYTDTATEATYIVVSEKTLANVQGGFFSNITDAISGFFKWFLGWA